MAKRNKAMMYVYSLIILMFLGLILSFKNVSDFVGEKVNVAGTKINNVARTVFGTALGIYLIGAGIAALTVPIIGLALIAIGVVLVAYFVMPWLKKGGEVKKDGYGK